MPRAPGAGRRPKHGGTKGKLALLRERERRTFLSFLIQEIPVRQAWRNMRDLFPESEDYNERTVANFAASEQCDQEREQLLQELRAEAPKRGFADRNSRIAALNKAAGRLLGLLWSQPDENITEIVKLSQEFRNTMATIRDETDPLGIQDTATLSHLEEYLRFKREHADIKGLADVEAPN